MKIVSIALIALLAAPAFATGSRPVYDHKDLTCAQFKQAVQHYGSIQIMFLNGWATRVYHSDMNSCRWDEKPVATGLKAKNGESCVLRWACETDHSRNR